jgi:hypothetical protein
MWTWLKRIFGKKSDATPAPALPSYVSASRPSFTVEPPLTTYDERRLSTPNKQAHRIKPEAIVLHHSDGSYRGSCAWITNPAAKVSYQRRPPHRLRKRHRPLLARRPQQLARPPRPK